MAKEKIKVKTETTAEAYVVEVIEPKIDTIQQDINQTKLDQKTCLSTIVTHNNFLKEAFEEMKQQKAEGDTIEVCTKEEVRKLVKEEVSSSMKAALKGFSMKASIADSCYERIDQRIEKMDASLKRPPLMKVNMNLSAKILVIIIMVLLGAGVAGYFWFVNTPMYLGYELYQSSMRLNHRSPGQRFHFAYQTTAAGRRKVVKTEIRNSHAKEKDYCAYTDTLRQVLADTTVLINGIIYGSNEKIIDYTDETGIVKSAHFCKDGSIRITDDQRMITPENARQKGIKWVKVR